MTRSRGTATVVAMIFMVLLAALAAGFGSLVTTSIQVSRNEQAASRAQAAAESGLEVFKSYLTQVSIPFSTPPNGVTNALEGALQTLASGSADGAGNSFVVSADQDGAAHAIKILFPYSSPVSYMKLHSDSQKPEGFRVEIVPDPLPATGNAPKQLRVTVIGTDGIRGLTRQIMVDFNSKNVIPPGLFAYGVYSNGGINIGMNATITGTNAANNPNATVMSASGLQPCISLSQHDVVTGNVYVTTDTTKQISMDKQVTTGGISTKPAPNMPTFDPSVFRNWELTSYSAGISGTVNSLYIPPNSNVTIGNNLVVNGIIYIDSPNKITVSNSLTVNGAIIFAKNATPGADTLSINNNTTITGMGGYAILAPTANVTFWNNTTTTGSIICNKISLKNNLTANFQNGTLLAYSPDSDAITVEQNSTMIFNRSAVTDQPTTGATYVDLGSMYFALDMTTYSEGTP